MNQALAPGTYPQMAMDMSAYQNANTNMPQPTYPVAPPPHPGQQQQAAYYQQPLL